MLKLRAKESKLWEKNHNYGCRNGPLLVALSKGVIQNVVLPHSFIWRTWTSQRRMTTTTMKTSASTSPTTTTRPSARKATSVPSQPSSSPSCTLCVWWWAWRETPPLWPSTPTTNASRPWWTPSWPTWLWLTCCCSSRCLSGLRMRPGAGSWGRPSARWCRPATRSTSPAACCCWPASAWIGT